MTAGCSVTEAGEPPGRDQHRTASLYVTGSTVLSRPLMTTCMSPSQPGQHRASEAPGAGAAQSASQACCPPWRSGCPRAQPLAPHVQKPPSPGHPVSHNKRHQQGASGYAADRLGRSRCHPAAILKRQERTGKEAFQREILSAFCSTSLESLLLQVRGITLTSGQRLAPDLALGDCTVQPPSTYCKDQPLLWGENATNSLSLLELPACYTSIPCLSGHTPPWHTLAQMREMSCFKFQLGLRNPSFRSLLVYATWNTNQFGKLEL